MEIGLPFSFHVLSMHGSFHLNASLMKKKVLCVLTENKPPQVKSKGSKI